MMFGSILDYTWIIVLSFDYCLIMLYMIGTGEGLFARGWTLKTITLNLKMIYAYQFYYGKT